jgi:hypothetical protein
VALDPVLVIQGFLLLTVFTKYIILALQQQRRTYMSKVLAIVLALTVISHTGAVFQFLGLGIDHIEANYGDYMSLNRYLAHRTAQ